MSAVTVTYQELPPMASWLNDGHAPFADAVAHFNDTSQYHAAAWHPFCLESNDAKCTTLGPQIEPSTPVDWVGATTMPLPPPAYNNAVLYNRSMSMDGVYDNGCPSAAEIRTGAKKRYSHHARLGGMAGGNGVGVGGGGGGAVVSAGAPEELCLVCGDKASGYHYNALTCEGCKGFFRRSITRKAMYYCKYGGLCDIDMYMRRKCQACRLRKCLDIGMRPELVIPEEQCRLKRESKNKMRSINANNGGAPTSNDERKSSSPQQVTSTESLSPNPGAQGLTPEQRELVHRLVTCQEQYEMPGDEELAKLSAFRSEQQQPQQQHQNQFQHLAELTILNVQLIVEFTKHLPGFLTLNKEDQLTLLKACSTEILMLKMAKRYDQKNDAVMLGNHSTSWAYSREAYKQAGMGSATDAIFEFAKSMAKLKVDAVEFALLTAISIFSERPGLSEPRKVEDIQEVYTSTLQAYIDVHRPKNRTVFARLLMKLTDLRTLGCEQADALFLKVDSGCRLESIGGGQTRSIDQQDPMADGGGRCPAKKLRRSDQSQSVDQIDESPASIGYRMPSVRIKVEPINNGTSGYSADSSAGCYSTSSSFVCNNNDKSMQMQSSTMSKWN